MRDEGERDVGRVSVTLWFFLVAVYGVFVFFVGLACRVGSKGRLASWRVWTIASAAFGLGAFGIWLAFRFPVPVKQVEDVPFVVGEVGVSATVAYERLVAGLESEVQKIPKFRRSYVSPREGRLSSGLYALAPPRSEELSRYVALREPSEPEDFYVDTNSMGWPSEYYGDGAPLPFRCDFLIHLEPAGTSSTRIHVMELSPQVIVGRKFFPIGRHIVPEFHAVRVKVAPTASDRREILEVALAVSATPTRAPPKEREPP